MLQLVLGGSGSGKTTLLYQKMKERALAGQKSILIVPEQFTASTESRIYHELGDRYSGMVESFSFTTLAEQVLVRCGGAAIKTLSDAGRAVLVRRAMKELQDNLVYYRKQRQNAAFCQMVAQTIDEFKSAGVDAAQLSCLAQQCGGGRDKLADLALIFAAYEAGVQATELDPADRVNLAAQQLLQACSAGETPDFLADRAVFIDEFDTFNAPKKKLLGALFCAVDSIMASLCVDALTLPQADPSTLHPTSSIDQTSVGCALERTECDATTAPDSHKPTFLEDVSLFSGGRRVAFDLRALARKAGVGVAAPIILRDDLRHADAPALVAVRTLLEGGVMDAPVAPAQQDALCLFAAQNREEEARAAAAEMQRLVRGGAAYGKMAIVCRNLDQYRTVVQRACRLAGIPLFCDETTTPTFSAPVTAVRALLSIIRGVDYTDQMIALAKTGLCAAPQRDADGKTSLVAIPEYQILALENYVYTWSPTRAAWREPFTRNPNGFGEMPRDAASASDKEPAAETARKALLAPIERLCADTGRKTITATELTKGIYHCLQALGAEQQQSLQVGAVRRVRGIPAAEAAAREWNVVMSLLDQMVQLLGDEVVSPTEYAELFLLLLNTSDLGHIPQNVDAVIFTSAGKMRLDAPDYVFVLGLAEGEFPAPPSPHGLLTDADRDALMQQEIELPDCFENKMVREDICFYKALTAPAKLLWMSWPEGLALPHTSALAPVLAEVQPHRVTLDFGYSATTPAAAIDRLGSLWGDNTTEAASLYAALQMAQAAQESASAASASDAPAVLDETALPEAEAVRTAARSVSWGSVLAQFDRIAQDAPKQLALQQPIAKLLGDTIEISPSKVEKYYTCQYAYFMQYLLRLRPRQKAELTPNHSGSLMHWVLEKAITTEPTPYDKWKPVAFVALSAAQLKTLAEGLCDAYQALYMPDDSVRFGYLLLRLKKSMVALLAYVQQELKQSQFAPAACEAKIGEATFPAPEYPLDGGRCVRLIGLIDRIDTWQDEAGTVWMRVVDYKTGQKTFHLKEVYDGLDCQMLLYLFAALRHWDAPQAGNKKAAGVLYLLADPAPQEQGRDKAATPLRPGIEGLLAEDDAVLLAVDGEQTGEYLPFALQNGKIPALAKKRKLADEAKMQRIEKHLDHLVVGMAEDLYAGKIQAEPLCTGSSNPCVWCEFRAICGHETGKHERGLSGASDPFEEPEAPEQAKEEPNTPPLDAQKGE